MQTSQVAAPHLRGANPPPHRNGPVLHVPTLQRQEPRGGNSVLCDWNRFSQRHGIILQDGIQIRSRILKRVVQYAKLALQGRSPFSVRRVVYAVVHARVGRVYIGSTQYDCLKRFKEHVYDRFARKSSSLSRHIGSLRGDLQSVLQQFYVLPLQLIPEALSPKRYEEIELDWMRKFSPKTLFNQYRLVTNRRRRHNPPPHGPPESQALPPPRRFRASTVRHLLSLDPMRRIFEMNRMRDETLRSVKHAAKEENCRSIDQIATDILNQRRLASRDNKKPEVLHVRFPAVEVERTRLHKILQEAQHLWKDGPREWRVVHTLNRQIGSMLFNFTNVATQPQRWFEEPCECARLYQILPVEERDKHFSNGHVLSSSVDCLQLVLSANDRAYFELLCEQGSKFRLRENPTIAIATLHDSLRRLCNSRNAPIEWADFILRSFTEKLRSTHQQQRFPSKDIRHLLGELHEKFVVTPADKNPQKVVFWCKHLYYRCITQEIPNAVFQDTRLDMEGAFALARADFARAQVPFGEEAMAYLYIIPKLHRLEPHRSPVRLISGKSGKNVPPGKPPLDHPVSFLSAVSEKVGLALNAIIDLIIHDDQKNAIRKCWIIRDPEEFISVYGRLPNDISKLQTCDFTTMYTQLDHQDLLNSLKLSIQDAATIIAPRFGITTDQALAPRLREERQGRI